MRPYQHALASVVLLSLSACPKTNNDVGGIAPDSGDTAPSSGGVMSGTGGTSGSGGASVITPTGGTTASAGGAGGDARDASTGSCSGPDDCPAACTGLCAPAVTDGSLPLKGVGGSCSVLVDAAASQGVYNSAAPECSSGLCLKPIVSPSIPGSVDTVDTTAFCTSECSTDDDCASGLIRDPKNPNDRTCKSGYTCGIPFVKGPICCKKLCVCKDFTGGAMETPTGCASWAGDCNELSSN